VNLTLPTTPRLLIEAALAPLQGTRFQPTGFPDIGAATYTLPDGTPMLLLESAQSIANRLESVCWDDDANDLIPELKGLSYVRVTGEDGQPLTSSVLEAHRLNSAYIENSDRIDEITAAVGYVEGKPFDRKKLAAAVARYDIGALLHGVFLESIAGVLRIPRALSGFIEASNVEVVAAGGVKNDRVRAGKDAESGAGAAEGYGNVPFHRDEYTAKHITAYFNLDIDQIKSYGLGVDIERLLYALALFKIQRFLERGLRLRTACDLKLIELRVMMPQAHALPKLDELVKGMPELIRAAKGRMADPPITVVKHGKKGKTEKKAKSEKKS
jgi:CRISPR-associated protein Csb1